MKSFLRYSMLYAALFTSCTAHSQANRSADAKTSAPGKKSANAASRANGMIFIKHRTIDNEGTGMVASSCLIPSDWTMKEKLFWQYDDPVVPIRYKNTIQSKDAKMLIQCYPDSRHSWYTGLSGTQGYRPPADIIEGLKFLIGVERREKNIRYTGQKILTDYHQTNGQAKSTSQSGVVKVEYEENGETMEEEFYGQLDVSEITSAMIWGASSLYSCKAPRGQLNNCRKIAQTIRYSAQLTKPFFNRLAQVIQLLSNQYYQQIYQAGQISKIISQTNDQMIANIDASYRSTQQASERLNNQFSDYIRGVDRWNDGNSEVQLPSGYNNAWVNERGEYLVTNTQGYNPGTDYNGTWKELNKK